VVLKPVGRNTPHLRQSLRAKIFHFTEIRNCGIHRNSPAHEEGRFASRSKRGPGCDGRGSVGTRGAGRAGSPCEPVATCRRTAPKSGEASWRSRMSCVRQNRVVLAVVATVKPFAEMCASPTGRTASSIRGAREAKRKGRLPGEHGISRPTIAQGRPCVGLHLYAAVQSFLRYMRTADRGCQPAPGLPCALFLGASHAAKLGRMRREDASVCPRSRCGLKNGVVAACLVIGERSEAIQGLSAEGFWIASLRSQ